MRITSDTISTTPQDPDESVSPEETHQALVAHIVNSSLESEIKQQVLSILESPTIRYVGKFDIEANPALFTFLLDYMDATSLLIRQFGLGNFLAQRLGPHLFHVDDQEGARALVRLLYADSSQRIYLNRGTYESTLLPLLTGASVLSIHFLAPTKGNIQTTFTLYAKIHNKFIGLLIKIVTALAPGIVEKKIKRGFEFLTKLQTRIDQNPIYVYQLLRESSAIDREAAEVFRKMFLPEQ